jgi:hypothetical protein
MGQYLLQDSPFPNPFQLPTLHGLAESSNKPPAMPLPLQHFLLCSAPFPTASPTSPHTTSSSFVCYEFNYLICSESDLITRQGISINSLDDRTAQPTTTVNSQKAHNSIALFDQLEIKLYKSPLLLSIICL